MIAKWIMVVGVCVVNLFITGCATIFNWSAHPLVNIGCDQPDVKVRVFNRGRLVSTLDAPSKIRLESSPSFFRRSSYEFEFSKPGYETVREKRVARMSGWYWGNIAIGGVIGMFLVDPASGSMYRISDVPVWARMRPVNESVGMGSAAPDDGFVVKCLTYDEKTRKGVIVLEVKGNRFAQARNWARKYIEAMSNDKNVALKAGTMPTGGTFYLGRENIRDGGVLEIEFEVE